VNITVPDTEICSEIRSIRQSIFDFDRDILHD
jgi:hypothetical protein